VAARMGFAGEHHEPNRHASRHADITRHPVIAAAPQWCWSISHLDILCELIVEANRTHHNPLSQGENDAQRQARVGSASSLVTVSHWQSINTTAHSLARAGCTLSGRHVREILGWKTRAGATMAWP
jgi:hypothetical protein